MPFGRFFRRLRNEHARPGHPAEAGRVAHDLYDALVAQARRPDLYLSAGIPDTLDGRFDMVVLHAVLVIRRLGAAGAGAQALSQAVFDIMFADMDQSLRELGVGDMGVGKRVKQMAKAFYGRAAAYEAGLAGAEGLLEAALARNLYGTVTPAPGQLATVAAYVRRQAAVLAAIADDQVLAGRIAFGEGS